MLSNRNGNRRIPGWYLRNFYGKEKVMEKSFREQSINKVVKQVSQSAGWLLITSKDSSVTTLLGTGKRMQRLFLKVRERNIAIHPIITWHDARFGSLANITILIVAIPTLASQHLRHISLMT